MRRCRSLLLFTLLAAAACSGERTPEQRTISRERFVEANVALRQIDPTAADAARQRAAVLEAHQVTEEQLRSFVAVHRRETAELARIWEEIQRELDRKAEPEVVEQDSVS